MTGFDENLGSMAEEIREIARKRGLNPTTITLNGNTIDVRDTTSHFGYDVSAAPPEGFAKGVLEILNGAAAVYADRNAVYKDNFRMVGQVMVALFPDGRPPLTVAEEYDRWHIFELLIVKLTRYANNYDNPHEDSLVDMLPYIGILGELDNELRARIKAARDKENEALALIQAEKDRVARDVFGASRHADHEAAMYADDFIEDDDEDEPETGGGPLTRAMMRRTIVRGDD